MRIRDDPDAGLIPPIRGSGVRGQAAPAWKPVSDARRSCASDRSTSLTWSAAPARAEASCCMNPRKAACASRVRPRASRHSCRSQPENEISLAAGGRGSRRERPRATSRCRREGKRWECARQFPPRIVCGRARRTTACSIQGMDSSWRRRSSRGIRRTLRPRSARKISSTLARDTLPLPVSSTCSG